MPGESDYIYNIASVEKTMHLIELLAETNGELSALELSKKLDTHSSSVVRFLHTLQYLGYVCKDERTGKYRLSDKLLELDSKLVLNHPLTKMYLDTMHTIAYQFDTTTHIMAFHGMSTITLHKDLQTHDLSYNNAFFNPKRYHYCSAPGKLLLSTLSEEKLSEYFSTVKYIKFTKNTLVSEDTIRKNLEKIRADGYSIHDEEWLTGNLTVAFPLRVNEKIKGAMSIMCSIDRKEEMLSPETIDSIKKMIVEPMIR